ncbi:histidinol-phosphate transaminase [Asticcacaulis endophyticus]|uniref:Histidinol-phosphate aminotransferase n=1 Tax=Asticcacaulis endophyticus TaxID=1395890 RepID=A0A918PZ53_9CAUL|nr:histidinol-phosphate transaminase [Asticcacaulis endophyticus]GGZ27873.1 histidinol-phosphate aminotransferase [Asticcacaulis endophyticus]
MTDILTRLPQPKPGIMDIHAYVGGKSKIEGVAEPIKLSSNENALGCSALALAAYDEARAKLFRYPDGLASPLRSAVAAYHDLEPERLIFGNGSDEVFGMLNQTYLQPGDNIVTGEFGFLAYRISAQACQSEVRLAPEPELRVEIPRILELVDDRTRIVYISNPANPTGTWNTPEEIAYLRSELDPSVILVIDEAYAEFADEPTWETSFGLARAHDNIVVTRTFSKIHGLAGLRVGFGYAPIGMIEAMERMRMPFNINLPAQYAAAAALQDQAHIDASRQQVLNWRPRLIQEIRALGYRVERSAGNFLLIHFDSEQVASDANDHLMREGILIRWVKNYGLPQALRVTVGKDDENRAFLEALARFKA